MVQLSSISALVAILASSVLAKDSTKCYTAMTDKKPARYPPTKWSTHYTPCTTVSYSTVYEKTTPKVTKTQTKTITVTDSKKAVSTVTTVKNETKKTVVTSTSTGIKKTSTDVVETKTAPAPANFTPIQSSLPGATNETIPVFQDARSLEKRKSPSSYSYGSRKTYPKMVMCEKYTKDKKCKAKKVIVTKKVVAKPKTIYVKATKIQTKTKCPKAKRTVTITSTSVKPITSTAKTVVQSTTTLTNIVSTTTINAACLSQANYANTVNNQSLVRIEPIPDDRALNVVQFAAQNDIACCNAALEGSVPGQSLANAGLFIFDLRRDDTNQLIGFCTLLSANQCGNMQSDLQYEVLNEEQAGPQDGPDVQPNETPAVLGNARCGLAVGPVNA